MILSARISITVLVLTSVMTFGSAGVNHVFGKSLTQTGLVRVEVGNIEVAATTTVSIIPVKVFNIQQSGLGSYFFTITYDYSVIEVQSVAGGGGDS